MCRADNLPYFGLTKRLFLCSVNDKGSLPTERSTPGACEICMNRRNPFNRGPETNRAQQDSKTIVRWSGWRLDLPLAWLHTPWPPDRRVGCLKEETPAGSHWASALGRFERHQEVPGRSKSDDLEIKIGFRA